MMALTGQLLFYATPPLPTVPVLRVGDRDYYLLLSGTDSQRLDKDAIAIAGRTMTVTGNLESVGDDCNRFIVSSWSFD